MNRGGFCGDGVLALWWDWGSRRSSALRYVARVVPI